MSNKSFIKILLILIITLASVVRIYQLDSIPPAISWDEAAVGYNAWTIATYGRDEYGKIFPFSFKSFGDDKHPVHIYSTAVFVKLFGLSEFTTRLPSAVFGVLNILLIFYLSKILFKNEWMGIIAAINLSISPYHIQFSRFNHELTFTLFFFMLGLLLFFKGIEGKKYLLPLSFLSFGIDLLSYHSAKIVVPPLILLLAVLYTRKLRQIKGYFLTGIFLLSLFLVLIVLNPALLGTARSRQTAFSEGEIRDTLIYQKTQNELLGFSEIVFKNYLSHFDPKYLFQSGGENPKFSTQKVGEFYKIDALFLVVGLWALLWMRSKVTLFLLAWAFIAPLPSSLINEAPHAARALFTIGSWHLISAYGFYTMAILFRRNILKYGVISIAILILLLSLSGHLRYYFGEYPKERAIDWQYGMKQIVEFVKDNPQYDQIFTTDIRFQPYIFFLYYLKTPLPEYLRSVVYNNSESKSYSRVSYFEKYFFGGWDTVESEPNPNVLYVLSPSEYDGLFYKQLFEVKKLVYYPNGSEAFYLVSRNFDNE